MKRATPSRGGIGVLVAGALLVLPLVAHAQPVSDWPMGGRDLSNTRHQPNETAIGPETVPGLKPKWLFTAGGDVSATPAVAGDAVYVPDWAGNLFKVDARTGTAVWTRRLSELTAQPKAVSRTTPAIGDGAVYLHPGRRVPAGRQRRDRRSPLEDVARRPPGGGRHPVARPLPATRLRRRGVLRGAARGHPARVPVLHVPRQRGRGGRGDR